MQEIGLGWKVKDKITGFTGVVNHVVEYAYQGKMAGVAPTNLDKDGKLADAEMFDFNQLEVLDDKPLFKIPKAKDFKFKFGEKVQDTLTGYKGKVGGLATYINGCNRILIQPEYEKDRNKDGKARVGEFFAEGGVISIETPEEKKERKEVPKAKTGGPADFDSRL